MAKKFLLLGVLALASCEQAAETALDDIHMKVAADAVKQYEMVERHGSAADKCAHAGIVAAAYLQAQKEREYQHWKTIEGVACANAGV